MTVNELENANVIYHSARKIENLLKAFNCSSCKEISLSCTGAMITLNDEESARLYEYLDERRSALNREFTDL